MPMIVSGLDPQVRMNAYLNGQQAQMQLKKQQDALRLEQDQQQAAIRAQIQKAMADHQTEQAKALKDANERAQMGEVQAMLTQDMEARAAQLPPEQKRQMEYAKLRGSGRITSPAALKALDEGFASNEAYIKEQKELKAADDIIATGAKDGLVDAADMEARKAAGEDPKVLAREVATMRKEQAQASVAMNESTNASNKMQMLIDALDPESPARKRLELMQATFLGSKTAQETPGAGKKMLAQAQKVIQAEEFKEGVDDIRGGLSGAMFGTRAPKGETPGDHATVKGLKAGTIKPGKRNPQMERSIMSGVAAAISAGQSPGEWLSSQGVELTPEVVEMIRGLAAQGAPDAATAGAE